MRVLVTGASGQLGQELHYLHTSYPDSTFLFADRETLDITDTASITSLFEDFRPNVVINCAAYTAVDKAEEEQETCYAINRDAVGRLASICAKQKIQLIHISTDYVYDLDVHIPLIESDRCDPRSIYAKSKREGELLMIESGVTGLILRVSWLYSSFGHNFVKTMLRLGESRDSLSIVNDQIGAPTYARDLAEVILHLIHQHDIRGCQTYNYSNDGKISWKSFAEEIFAQSGIECKVSPTTTEAYGAPAPRPLWSVLSKEKIKSAFRIKIHPWQESLSRCLDELGAKA